MNAPLPDAVRRALTEVTLDDKWTLDRGRAYMSGTQALLRLAMLQHQRDQLAGLNTAGFITGYRGSPLGAVDQTAWKARKHLERHDVRFQPGLNEDLAATSVWGTQQLNLFEGAKVDGVFSMWYGKGPGVDRCGDVFKHANAAGTSRHGGVLALAGDDHGAKSSTLPHQSDHIFKACMMPVLFPATVQEYLDLGLHGFAMSRYAGVWVAMKTVTEVVEASASVVVDPERVDIQLPADFRMPPAGLNIRWPDSALEMEARLLDYKLYAALAYCRANKLNHTVIDSPHARFGIVASGKAFLDTRQALADLGLDDATCADIGIRLFKCGMVWPLEATAIRGFAEGLEEILVVEEKRQLLEYQLKEELFSWIGTGKRIPRVIGKFDEKDGGEWAVPQGNWILPAHYEFSPAIVAKAIAQRIGKLELPADIRARMQARLAIIEAKEKALARPRVVSERKPWFCSGCPHNTSTNLPEGSRGVAGIGCHYMVVWMDRNTSTYTQMGGEGVPWIGQAPFTNEKHIFANLGDGTYFHSGSLAVRAAVAAGVRITYKILFNDAVAMTGGQPTDGQITAPLITQQMAAEGVQKIVIVTDEPEKYDATSELVHTAVNAHGATGNAWKLAPGVTVHHRDELERIQRELREYPGVSVLIYDQTCASEKRRRRKKNTPEKIAFPDPARRVVINDLVCEGCGDCSVKSNCLSVEPLETEFGRKRQINQSSCNKDYSCLKGFCPSFVTVEGGKLRKGKASAAGTVPDLPHPTVASLRERGSYGIVITGVGGTGVVTIGQLLGMAAHLEGKGVSVLDMAGLAQKGGAVFSHVQIAPRQQDLFATRIAMGDADVLLGCDLVVTSSNEALSKVHTNRTRALVNTSESPTADFVRNPDWQFGSPSLAQQVREAVGDSECAFVDANALATRADGRRDLHQPVHAGLRMAEGLAAARVRNDGARDRDQRRRGRQQPQGLRVGALCRARPRSGPADRLPGQRGRAEAVLQLAGGTRGAPRRVPDRLPEREVRAALRGPGGARAQGRVGPAAVEQARGGGRPQLLPPACVQGRVRSGATALGPGVPRADRRAVRGRLLAELLPGAAAALEDRSGHRPPAEEALRAADDDGVLDPREAEGTAWNAARHLRPHRRATHRAAADRRVRSAGRRAAREARPRQPCGRAAARRTARGDPRLRACQGEQPAESARARWTELLARFRGQQVAQVIRMPSRAA